MKHKNAVPETGKLMAALFALLLCICLTDGTCAASKTEIPEGYTPIKSVDDLYGINNNPEGSYILMNDIDLSQTAAGGKWDFGNRWKPIEEFYDTLDGNGYRIMNIY